MVFIDDLDRCLPDQTVQVLEAIKLFVDKHGCIFVIGVDTGIVQNAVKRYYADKKPDRRECRRISRKGNPTALQPAAHPAEIKWTVL